MEELASHAAAQLHREDLLYKQVALRISELIEHGTLRPGERVPSVRRLSQQQNVSIATVTQAYRFLEDRGLLVARPQSGYFVRVKPWVAPPVPDSSRPALRPVNVCVNDRVLQVIKAGRDPNMIRLGATLPNPELFPVEELNRTMAAVGRRSPGAANSYHAPPGNQSLRVQIARRALEAGCTLSPEDVITTVG